MMNTLFVTLIFSCVATLINCLYYRTIIRLNLYSLRSAFLLFILVTAQNLPCCLLIIYEILKANDKINVLREKIISLMVCPPQLNDNNNESNNENINNHQNTNENINNPNSGHGQAHSDIEAAYRNSSNSESHENFFKSELSLLKTSGRRNSDGTSKEKPLSREEYSLGLLQLSRIAEIEAFYLALLGRRLTRTDSLVILGSIVGAQCLSFIGFGG